MTEPTIGGPTAAAATTHPVTTVGEIGIATRQPSFVSVQALDECHLLDISRHRFESLLREDHEIGGVQVPDLESPDINMQNLDGFSPACQAAQ